jgi:hypothetical protein
MTVIVTSLKEAPTGTFNKHSIDKKTWTFDQYFLAFTAKKAEYKNKDELMSMVMIPACKVAGFDNPRKAALNIFRTMLDQRILIEIV